MAREYLPVSRRTTYIFMMRLNIDTRIEVAHRLRGNMGLRLTDVLGTKEELAIQIAYIDCVQVHNLEVTKA